MRPPLRNDPRQIFPGRGYEAGRILRKGVLLAVGGTAPDLHDRLAAGALNPRQEEVAVGRQRNPPLPVLQNRAGHFPVRIGQLTAPVEKFIPGLRRIGRIEPGGLHQVGPEDDRGHVPGRVRQAVDLAVDGGDLPPERPDLLPARPFRLRVADLPVAVEILADPLVERIEEVLLDLVSDDVEPRLADIRRGVAGKRHHQRSAAGGKLDAAPLPDLDVRIGFHEVDDLLGRGTLRIVRIEEFVHRHHHRRRRGRLLCGGAETGDQQGHRNPKPSESLPCDSHNSTSRSSAIER